MIDGTPQDAGARPKRARNRRAWLIGAGLAFAGAALFGLGWALKPGQRLNAVAYGGERIHIINAHLRQAEPNDGFMAGDSFVEHYSPEPLPCGRSFVNGGVSGAKVADYLKFLDSIRFERKPPVILLTTGLNDLLKKHDPTGAAALGRFRQNVEALVDRLTKLGDRLVVAAIPPIPDVVEKFFDTRSFQLYTDTLKAICAQRGCTYVDPFVAVRDGVFWRGKPGSSLDGLHLANLRQSYRTIYPELCR